MGGPEKPTEAPSAEQKMGEFMPEVEHIDQPIEPEMLKEMTKGYPEVKAKKYAKLVKMAKDAVAKSAGGTLPHQASIPMTGEDGHEYVYVRDNTSNPADRLFRSPEAKVSILDETLEEGYAEAPKKMASRIIKAAKRFGLLKGMQNGESFTISIDDGTNESLVANNLMTAEQAEEVDGDVVAIVKAKGKFKAYFGYQA